MIIPEPPLDPPEDSRRIVNWCRNCLTDIYEGDGCYHIDGVYYCESCVNDAWCEAEYEED